MDLSLEVETLLFSLNDLQAISIIVNYVAFPS
jgi:hypothetical protein